VNGLRVLRRYSSTAWLPSKSPRIACFRLHTNIREQFKFILSVLQKTSCENPFFPLQIGERAGREVLRNAFARSLKRFELRTKHSVVPLLRATVYAGSYEDLKIYYLIFCNKIIIPQISTNLQ